MFSSSEITKKIYFYFIWSLCYNIHNGDYMSYQKQNLKMQNYLFKGGRYPFKEDNFRFLMINIDNSEDEMLVYNFLEELFFDGFILKEGKDSFLFYFIEPEISFKDLFVSISADFSVPLKVYVSGKINQKYPENFHLLYKNVKEFLSGKPYLFSTNAELIKEIIRTDFKKLKEIRPAVLNRIFDDTQMEKLILSLFENNLNVTRTAQDVYMHRNTVINKLEYIKQETGLNLQKFTDAACMYWLLKTK